MVFLKAEAFFNDHSQDDVRLIRRGEKVIPELWLTEFRKAARGDVNGVIATPAKTFALRRSIITRQSGNTGEVSWRLPYAVAQNRGYSDDGIYYQKYTTAGTGPGFAEAAADWAKSKMPQILRESGLTK